MAVIAAGQPPSFSRTVGEDCVRVCKALQSDFPFTLWWQLHDILNAVSRPRKEHATSKVVAIMSMSLDGYVGDLNLAWLRCFHRYFTLRNVKIHTEGPNPVTFKVSARSTFAVSRPDMVARLQIDAHSTLPEAWGEITLGDQHE